MRQNVAAGTTRLTGDSSGFTGTTSLAGGRLDIDGKLGGNLTVAAGTTLGGSGSIGGDVTVTGGAGIVLDGLMFSDGDGAQPDATRPGTPHVHIGGGSGIRIRDIQASGAPIVRRASSVPAATIVTDPDVPVSVG